MRPIGAAALLAAAALVAGAGCAPAARRRLHAMGALDAHYLARRAQSGAASFSGDGPSGGAHIAPPAAHSPPAAAPATRIYRSILRPTLYSRCRMVPSDSELFDERARACGGAAAAVLGISRLYLEVSASPRLLPVTVADKRLRWLDRPKPSSVCAP